MSFKYKILFTITPAVFILDQLTKWLVIEYIPYRSFVSVVPGYFDLVFVRNPGAAFGMLANTGEDFRKFFFYIVAVVAVVVLASLYIRLKESARLLPIAISLIFAGIAGNILDRIRFGVVTDFISVHVRDVVVNFSIFGWHLHVPLDWPAFNIADSAITAAMFLLVITAFRKEQNEK